MKNKIRQSTLTPILGAGKAPEMVVSGTDENSAMAAPQYLKPTLICYGDVRDITLGPSPGFGESGCECDRRPGASISCPVPTTPCFP